MDAITQGISNENQRLRMENQKLKEKNKELEEKYNVAASSMAKMAREIKRYQAELSKED